MKNFKQTLPQAIELRKEPDKVRVKQEVDSYLLEETSSLSLFFKQLGQYKLLSSSEEKHYLKLAHQGNLKARDKMIFCNQRLVLKIAKRYQNYGLELIDLIQEGILGLMTAIRKFNVDQETKFSTYASYWIEDALNRAIMNKGRAIRLPVHVAQAVNKVKKILRQCENLSILELAEQCNLTVEQVNVLLEVNQDIVSYDQPMGEDGETWINNLPDQTENTQSEIDTEKLKGCIFKNMQILKEKYQVIIIKRFGLGGEEPKKLEEIAKELNLSRERIRQILEQSLVKMKVVFEQEGVYSYCIGN